MFVFAGILPVLKNEDALAFVLGHETGHVLARQTKYYSLVISPDTLQNN